MDQHDIPDIFWDTLSNLSFDDLPPGPDVLGWRPQLPEGLTDVLEVAESDVSFGRMVHLVGEPTSANVAYTHLALQHGLLGMRVYFPARAVPGGVGIPAYVIGFRDLPQVRQMYAVKRVLSKLGDVSDAPAAYGRAVSSATVQQAARALAGLAAFESLPFTLFALGRA